jgi:hypothetical protein
MNSPDDIDAFHALMTTLAAFYPNRKPDFAAVLEGYFEDLKHLTLEQVKIVFVLARRRYDFFPQISQLLKVAGEAFASPPALPARDRALEAWSDLRRFSGMPYREVALEDPITRRCFEALGGKAAFGTWDFEREESRMRQYFCDLYRTYVERGAQWTSKEEAEALLKNLGFDHLFGGHWLGAGDDDDALTPRD